MKTLKSVLKLSTLSFALFSSSKAFAVSDKCKEEAREAAKLINGFNKEKENHIITATLEDEDTEYDHLITYKLEYTDPATGNRSPFSDNIQMKLQGGDEDTPGANCTINRFEKGGA